MQYRKCCNQWVCSKCLNCAVCQPDLPCVYKERMKQYALTDMSNGKIYSYKQMMELHAVESNEVMVKYDINALWLVMGD